MRFIIISISLFLLFENKFHGQNQNNASDSAMAYFEKNNFAKAIFWQEIEVGNKLKEYGLNDTLYAKALNNLAIFNFYNGNYIIAKKYIEIASPIFEQKLGKANQDFILSISTLGNVNQRLGNYKEAEFYLKKNIYLLENNKKTGTKDYPQALNNLAFLYNLIGKYEEAEKLYLNALGNYKKVIGWENRDVARTLDNLGKVRINLNNYYLGEQNLQEAFNIRKKLFGTKSLDFCGSLNNLGTVYLSLGNFKKAEDYLLESSKIIMEILGENHPEAAIGMGNLSRMYLKKNDYIKALKYAEKNLEILEKKTTKNSSTYFKALQNIINLNNFLNKDSIQLFRIEEAIKLAKTIYGDNSQDYSSIIFSLGQYYHNKNLLTLADSCFKVAQYIKEKFFLNNQLDYLNLLSNSLLCNNKNLNFKNDTNLIKSIEAEKNQLISNSEFFSEKELIGYLGSRLNNFTVALQVLKTDSILKDYLNFHLFYKSLALTNIAQMKDKVRNSNNQVIQKKWEAYLDTKLILNKEYLKSSQINKLKIDSLEQVINIHEKSLIESSLDFRKFKRNQGASWQTVKANLKPNEAAIEFVKFENLKYNIAVKDTVLYAAFIIRKQDTCPIYINLFEEQQLVDVLKGFPYKVNTTYKYSSLKNKQTLFELLWRPLEKYLNNVNTVYFAPDGLLHNIAFAAIPTTTNKLLSDDYKLVHLTSTRLIANNNDLKNENLDAIALYGGINYNKQNYDTASQSNPDPYSYVFLQNRGGNLDSFNYLPHTLKEIITIQQNAVKFNKSVKLFSGTIASEKNIKSLDGLNAPQILHIATHGFTLLDTNNVIGINNNFKISDNPLLRTGLILAGGNNGWKEKSNVGEEDGVLTGLEISSLNLANTKLAVLSACETGIGELKGSEGVFGLQRAFKLAGVKYILATLWQIPDKETSEFMTIFYTNLFKSKDVRKSFYTTQQVMRKKYSPYYWAGFTLIE